MRRFLIMSISVVLFVGIVGGALSYNLVTSSPYLPGDFLFSLQVTSERLWGLAFNNDLLNRADVWLEILAQRIQDMAMVQGTAEEETAVSYFHQAVIGATTAVEDVPAADQPEYQARLRQLLTRGLATLESLEIMQGQPSTETTNLYIQLRLMLQVDNPSDQQQARGQSLRASEEPGTDLTLTLSTNFLDDPHNVPFPPGVNMSEVHSFFPLLGGHSELLCSDCHTGESYKGAPSACVACHQEDDPHEGDNGTNCANCHNISDWQDVNFDHSTIGAQDCAACHNPPENHFSGACSNCHIGTSDWLFIDFDHRVIGAQDCANCHTRPANHYQGACSSCHSDTDNWQNAVFSHSNIGNTDCSSCHTPPANHFQGACSSCHGDTGNWRNASFNHSLIGNTDCSSCHAPPANHFQGACSSCHGDTGNWRNASFSHSSIGNTDCSSCHAPPNNHFQGACSLCHGDTGNWRNANFSHSSIGNTDCSSCHAPPNNHFPGSCSSCHVNTGDWHGVNFSHNGLTDCQSCHARPDNHFAGQCSDCHNTSNWGDANFSHSFPINHGGANGNCAACHPNGNNSGYSCYGCHDQQDVAEEHQEEGISDFGNCMACHPDGREHD